MESEHAQLELPQGLPASLKMSEADFLQEMCFMAAAKFFELGKLSSGKASELAGMNKLDFLRRLEQIAVPSLMLDSEQTKLEILAAKKLAG